MNKLFKNFVYQVLLFAVNTITPLISVPIVSKALGPQALGSYKYANSIITYFLLIAHLGIVLYGQRLVAMSRDNATKLSSVFWEIELLSLVASLFATLLFLAMACFLHWGWLFFLLSLQIAIVPLNISWFFMGIEEFRLISIRGMIISIASLILIINLIKSPEDLWIYAVILVGQVFAAQIIMWPFLRGRVHRAHIDFRRMLEHLKGALVLFIPTVAISLYTTMNVTLLGIFRDSEDVAYYTSAVMIGTIISGIISNVDTVLLPRLTNLYAHHSSQSITSIYAKSFRIIQFIAIPSFFGCCLLAPKLVPWFFGEKFLFVIVLIPATSVILLYKPIGLSISRQYLIPFGKLKEYNVSLIVTAIVGLIVNVSVTPFAGIWGSVASLAIAELTMSLIRITDFVKRFPGVLSLRYSLKLTICGLAMYIMGFLLTRSLAATPATTLIQIVLGIVLFMLFTMVLKCNIVGEVVKMLKVKQ